MKRAKRGLGLAHLPEVAETQILDFVGIGEWFFVGQVSKRWRYKYLKHCSQHNRQTERRSRCSSSRRKGLSRRTTSYKAVLASVPRLQLAINNGFDVERKNNLCYNSLLVAAAAGKYASKEVLLWLKTHQAALWGESLCGGAIKSGRLEILKWLHDEQQCAWSEYSGCMAAQSNNLSILKYIYHKGDGGFYGQHNHRAERSELSQCAMLSNNPKILSWCEKKKLLVNNYDGALGLYEHSLIVNRPLVQQWLYKHGYRLPVDHEEFTAMMERHSNDKH
jgi:hypothetical protein